MAEDIQGLIEKIQQEGIKAAEDKAGQIEKEADKKAQAIIQEAKDTAGQIVQEAKDKAQQTQASTQELLRQAARDLLISLKNEVYAVLNRVIRAQVQASLSPQEITKIITALVKGCKDKEGAEVAITLSQEDAAKVEETLIKELQAELKKKITLKASAELRSGFVISYDAGKSHYDFSDQALAEYIGKHLKPKLAQLLETSKGE